MRVLTLFFAIAVTGGACANSTEIVNKTPTIDPVDVQKNTSGEKETECKICDFEFGEYKGELKKEEIEGLLLALNDEYLATAIYKGVNEKFDEPRPFVNIIRAENNHANQLRGLFDKYKIPIPENRWIGKAPSYDSVKAACEAGVKAEIANMELYSKLFRTTDREDILFVYKNLQRASEQNHKPAFERCAAGGNRSGQGLGRANGGNR